MKKWLFYLSLILFLMPNVLADISIEGPAYNDYNLKDKIAVTVSLSNFEYLEGLLKVDLKCGTNELNYFTIPIELVAGKEKIIEVPSIVVTEKEIGECVIESGLYLNDLTLIESVLSQKFRVTNSLVVTVELDKTEVKPNDELKILGVAKTIQGNNVKEGNVKITITDFNEEFSILVNNGFFDYLFNFGSNVKSGNHLITVFVEDKFGNTGTANANFNVEAIPTDLKNNINQLSFKPEDTMKVGALLFDQAGDLIVADALIQIFDVNGKKVLEREIMIEEAVEFVFPKYALPGKWLIKTKSEKITIESDVEVEIVQKADFSLNDQILVVTNTGNVDYKNPFNIFLNDKIVTKKTSLKPGETVTLDLSKEIKEDGYYDTRVVSGDDEEISENVFLQHKRKSFGEFITGNVVLGSAGKTPSFVYYIIIAFVIIGFLVASYFASRREKEKKIRGVKDKEIKEAKLWADEVRTKKKDRETKAVSSFYDREKAIRQFRERIKFEEEKDKKKSIFNRGDYFEIKPKEKPFNFMVDKVKEDVSVKKDESFEEPLSREDVDFTIYKKKEKRKDDDEGSLFKMFD